MAVGRVRSCRWTTRSIPTLLLLFIIRQGMFAINAFPVIEWFRFHIFLFVITSEQDKPSDESSYHKKTDDQIPDDVNEEPSRTTNKSDLDKPVDEDEDVDVENDRNEGSESDVSL